MLYPLKFKPIFKEKVWGGERLQTVLNKEILSGKTGESWDVSGLKDNLSVVSEGIFSGKNIQELIDEFKADFLGKKVFHVFGNTFPLLIKFIDACDDLSVQVHPDDEFAQKKHNETGKNEMWYIVDAEPGSRLVLGVRKTVTRLEFLKAIKEKQIPALLNSVKVHSGDVLYVPSGRIHAIMKGVLLAEIQQCSDLTYRIYDWERKGLNGKYRELHTDLAAEVVELQKKENYLINYLPVEGKAKLVKSEHFSVSYLKISDSVRTDYSKKDSFVILMCVSGSLSVMHKKLAYSLLKGETILIPAAVSGDIVLVAEKTAELLEVYI